MVEVEYLTIAEFAEKAGVSKQAIYKQVNNENSQLSPYLLREGKKTLIKITALAELYKVDITKVDFSTHTEAPVATQTTQEEGIKVEVSTPVSTPTSPADNPTDNPETTFSTPENQPISTDYISFLKAQIAELKEDKAQMEQRLNATIQEKDSIIKQQTEQLANLAQQVARIADKALIATSQQQYLTAMEKCEKVDTGIVEDIPAEATAPKQSKKGFWSRLFNW